MRMKSYVKLENIYNKIIMLHTYWKLYSNIYRKGVTIEADYFYANWWSFAPWIQ